MSIENSLAMIACSLLVVVYLLAFLVVVELQRLQATRKSNTRTDELLGSLMPTIENMKKSLLNPPDFPDIPPSLFQ